MVQNGNIQVLYLQVAWIKPQQIYFHYRVDLDHTALDPSAELVHNAPTWLLSLKLHLKGKSQSGSNLKYKLNYNGAS